MRSCLALIFVLAGASLSRAADSPEGITLFEQRIRPLLVDQCYKCHSAQAEKVKGHLFLDTKQGMARGGAGGPVLFPGAPEKSRLIEALNWTDPDLKMPPKQQLTPQQIQWFEEWIRLGAPDPREAVAGDTGADSTPKRGMDIATGRKWWAFQPVAELAPPAVRNPSWVLRKSDQFILAKLEAAALTPSPRADRRTLIRRAYLDLTGLRPSYEEVEAFAKDDAPRAYDQLIDRLLASDHYGERWGRYWLDVVRYGEDNPTSEATNPPYGFAWRYRDWVINAVNKDVPYNRFVELQLAADEMPGTSRPDLAALGFLGAGPVYHKDGRLSKDVITTLYADDWDERIDTVTRGFLGMTVARARCHDHKFDAIPTTDYYALQGIFASVTAARPLANIDSETETRFMQAEQRLFYLSYAADLLRGDPGSKPAEAREKVLRFAAEMQQIKNDMSFLKGEHPEMYAQLDRLGRMPQDYPDHPTTRPALALATTATTRPSVAEAPNTGVTGTGVGVGAGAANFPFGTRRRGGSTAPFFESVFDAGTFVNGSDPDFTMIDARPGEARDMPVLPGGNVSHPGNIVPRRFLSVLSGDNATFHEGSGRRELGEKLFSDGGPLAARVIVNRVWAWHFGKPLVASQSDFGVQGELPTHPELLDDLAARFIANGWSLKWLHREIMFSAAYQQESHPRDDAMKSDPTNRLIWRMNPRRLDVEAFRDCVLAASGSLDPTMYGVSMDVDQPGNNRRTVYARVGRGRLSNMLRLFDFPEATMHSPGREVTTTPLQQLFVMNSFFMQNQAAALAQSTETFTAKNERVSAMYRKVLGRDPDVSELKLADDYLAGGGTFEQYAQALLCIDEVQFWP